MANPAPISTPICDELGIVTRAWVMWYQQLTESAKSGTTADRPELGAKDAGYLYFDTDLAPDGKPILWTGVAWVDSTGIIA
jgi:hypothetical protein